MSTVEVNDDSGKALGKVKVGETKLKALERLSRVGQGGLYDKDDVGLLDDDLITGEGAPYVFKRSEDQKSAQMEKVMEFVQSEMDDRTKNKDMSKASTDWVESILAGYRVKHDRVKEVVDAVGSFKDPPPYEWTVQTIEGETWNMGEHGGTPGALEWLKENFLRSSSPYDLKVVTGAKLPRVKGNRKSATGKSDILIGKTKDIHKGSTFDLEKHLARRLEQHLAQQTSQWELLNSRPTNTL